MPADFLRCVANGGKVITKTLSGGRYIKFCKDKKGKWHRGEVHKAQAKAKKGLGERVYGK